MFNNFVDELNWWLGAEMIIAHGDGGNGKSTFWNTILKVFDYGGTLSSDNLFINSGKSSRFAKAFLKGKRLMFLVNLN